MRPKIYAIAALCALLAAGNLSAGSDLEELRLRNAIPETRERPLKSDLAMLKAMKAAESEGAMDYLARGGKSVPGNYYITDAGGGRLLTLQGFQVYRDRITKEALSYFTAQGVPLSKVYAITGPSGESVMGDFGLLSYRGLEVYRAALKGEKLWYGPDEPRPLTPEETAARKFLGSEYTELSKEEYDWLKRTTGCSDKALKEHGVENLPGQGAVSRHFIRVHGPNSNGPIYSYIYKYRKGDRDAGSDRGTAFFGSGGLKRERLCGSDGNTWIAK